MKRGWKAREDHPPLLPFQTGCNYDRTPRGSAGGEGRKAALEKCQAHSEPTAPGVKHSSSICLEVHTVLERGETPAHVQYIDNIIVWGNTAKKAFQKGEKIIQPPKGQLEDLPRRFSF